MQHLYEIDVRIPVRDGVLLASNVWRPAEGKAPTLLARLPYGKDRETAFSPPFPNVLLLVAAGYAVVVQECRGTFGSEGEFVPHEADGRDGEDTIAWIAEQPWSDGTVGMCGPSYLGMVQWEAAVKSPPALKAIMPSFTSLDRYRAPWYSVGGALSLSLVTTWCAMMYTNDAMRAVSRGTGTADRLPELIQAMFHPEQLSDVVPTADVPVLKAYGKWWSDFMAHPGHDDYWEAVNLEPHLPKVTVPALHIGGWYDCFIAGTIHDFSAAQQHAGSAEQRLIIGPWDHLSTSGAYPDRSFGPMASSAVLRLTELQIKFFDRWVRGDTAALEDVAPVKIFVMGIDQWRDEQAWPLPGTRWTDYHLTSGGHANTSDGDGALATAPASRPESDTYLYDPRRPVPTTGGACLPMTFGFGGPVDQQDVARRDDVLCYTTPVLEEPVEVTGPVGATLFISSSAVDTDFTAKLVDVFPDGKAINLCDGILRVRYRDGLDREVPLEPGTVYEITVDMAATSNVFLAGHRIRLDISSSNFPRYDRNTNTGGIIAHESEEQMVPAVNRIHHGPEYSSRLVLPIINRSASS